MAPEADRLSRRTLLRRGVGVGGALVATASSGLFHTAPTDDPPGNATVRSTPTAPRAAPVDPAMLRLTVTVAANAPRRHVDRHLRPAVESYAVQAGIDTEFASVTAIDRSVSLDDDYERILDRVAAWADEGVVDRRAGHVNLLCYAQSPAVGSAYACDHRGTLTADSAPLTVCNTDVALFWPHTAYRNTLVTAVARPILAGLLGESLPNGETMRRDVNTFGTVHGGDVPRSSPLATWHTPAAGGCVKPDNFEGDDLVERHCGYDAAQASCGYTARLSECTRLATRARLAAFEDAE